MWLLGLGAFGLAFSITTTAAYLPPLLEEFTDSNTMIAAVLAAEGVFALTLPLVIGPWSDTFKTPMAAAALHAGGAPADGLPPGHPRVHAEHLDDDADRPWRSSSPTTSTSRRTAASTRTSSTRACTAGRRGVQHVLRGIALGRCPGRRRIPVQGLASRAVPVHAVARRPARRRGRGCANRGRGIARVPRGAELREDELDGVLRSLRGAPLPVRERRLGAPSPRCARLSSSTSRSASAAAVDVVGVLATVAVDT